MASSNFERLVKLKYLKVMQNVEGHIEIPGRASVSSCAIRAVDIFGLGVEHT